MSESDKTIDIVIPDIGDSESVEIIEILVAVGDQVSNDDSLLTLESDKASMEVPATSAGVIKSLTVSIGDSVSSGAVIGTMSIADSAASESSDKPAAAEAETPARETEEPAAAKPDKPTPPPASPAEPVKPAPSSQSTSPTAHLDDENMRKAHASPGVRRYARELGADLSLVTGTGPKARITKTDVTAFIKQALEGMGSNYRGGSGAAVSGGAGIPPIPEVDFSKFGEIERVELGRINKLSAANLHRAWLNLPMVTHHDLADVTEMEAFRKQLKEESGKDDPKVTGLAFHMKALVKSLQAFPKLNSSLSADGEALFYKHYYHIGIAVDTPNGLVVPVFRDVDKKSVHQLAIEMSDVSTRARQKKLKPDEMQGASMTISSLGGIGGTSFTPIVNPPEVAILGITRASMQPVWNGSEFIPRLMCPLDLTYDHRVVDGADAARFMAFYVRQISDIRRLTL
ncbi:dihydrolipoyllysine-residue acetyltransferase [Granulosicoccus antarcticus]|uniref:Acetyltransferase component of pyruvate dehydrogenase complex n=1 Tax=Granulosicoccus antarcticus IMCC3135 TaxID=1192854 RepID=A0A2Z2NM41_9GAMM|nr:dihydrolipoyllysine-residue acetyltransferase [Granulosicoccus antarcticus]ASJ72406.1 Dihydrolipoyllysine-residue acetyltransferase component of pyruvate dehydrogenase complex [Granulosicoccus antarcticus IMCC3135]